LQQHTFGARVFGDQIEILARVLKSKGQADFSVGLPSGYF
jgi:hypothetical protein